MCNADSILSKRVVVQLYSEMVAELEKKKQPKTAFFWVDKNGKYESWILGSKSSSRGAGINRRVLLDE